jgi:hypothetical protein
MNLQQYESEFLNPPAWEYAIKDIPYTFVNIEPIPSYMKSPNSQAPVMLSNSSHLPITPCVNVPHLQGITTTEN